MTPIQRASGHRPSYEGTASPETSPDTGSDAADFAGNPGLGLLALRIQSGAVHKKDLEGRVAQEAQRRDELRSEQREAEAEAREAQESSNKWGTVIMVARVTAIAASVAAAVVTGGSSLVVAAAIIGGCASVGGIAAEKCGASPALCQGLQIGGGALTAGAGLGAALGGQAAAQAGQAAAQTTARAAIQTAGATATGVQGGAMIGKGWADGEVLGHNAAALQARNGSADCVTQQKDDLDRLQRQATSDRHSIEAAAQQQHQHAAATRQLLSSMRG